MTDDYHTFQYLWGLALEKNMPIVGCSYSFAITDENISKEDSLAAMKECAAKGCVRCTNGLDPGSTWSAGSDVPAEPMEQLKVTAPGRRQWTSELVPAGTFRMITENLQPKRDPDLEREDEREPDPVVFFLFDSEQSFSLWTALDSDQNRVCQISFDHNSVPESKTSLLLDKEDARAAFTFFYEWLRYDNSLPILELEGGGLHRTEIHVQASGARPVILSYDCECEVYTLSTQQAGAWVEMTSVAGKEKDEKGRAGLSCPICQGGPIYPFGDQDKRFECGHCEASFTMHTRLP